MKFKKDWIEKNIEKMMFDVMKDARLQKPLPTAITLEKNAYSKFMEILRSKSIHFPSPEGRVKFLGIPIYLNNRLPFGTFTVERFSEKVGLVSSRS